MLRKIFWCLPLVFLLVLVGCSQSKQTEVDREVVTQITDTTTASSTTQITQTSSAISSNNYVYEPFDSSKPVFSKFFEELSPGYFVDDYVGYAVRDGIIIGVELTLAFPYDETISTDAEHIQELIHDYMPDDAIKTTDISAEEFIYFSQTSQKNYKVRYITNEIGITSIHIDKVD